MRTVSIEDLARGVQRGSGCETAAEQLEFVQELVDVRAGCGERKSERSWGRAQVVPWPAVQLADRKQEVDSHRRPPPASCMVVELPEEVGGLGEDRVGATMLAAFLGDHA